uniref:Uncharacterized protein n=1 Tax=Rhizophora mucronata TaxID=61149 RepID=A0A2P2QBB8_RHIMU
MPASTLFCLQKECLSIPSIFPFLLLGMDL